MTTHQDHVSPDGACVVIPRQEPLGPAVRAGRLIVDQVRAIDAWNLAGRSPRPVPGGRCASRHDREAARHEDEVRRRTQLAIDECTSRELATAGGPMTTRGTSAVIAHRHPWFAEQVAELLRAAGTDVVACTGNAADALGAVIAEQPGVVLLGDRLEMMSCEALLAEVRRFAPAARCVLEVHDGQYPVGWLTAADAVFFGNRAPRDVADVLLAPCPAESAVAVRS